MRIYPKEKVTTIADPKDKFLGLFEEGFTYTVWRNKNEMFVVDKEINQKSPGARLRNTLFVLWTQEGSREYFEDFYKKTMEGFIEKIKERLQGKSTYDRMCDTIYKTEQEDLLVGRVAGMLRDFMRECNDSNRWDARTSRAEVGGFMRSWAKKIIKEVKNDKL